MQEKIYKLKDLKKGTFIKPIRNGKAVNKVYIKGDYDKSTKSFSLVDFYDINHEILMKSNKEVLAGFIF